MELCQKDVYRIRIRKVQQIVSREGVAIINWNLNRQIRRQTPVHQM